MIPANSNLHYVARYALDSANADGRPRTEYLNRAVVGWNDAGLPVVADHQGRLVPASSLAGFSHVDECDMGDVVAVLPGGGWVIHQTNTETGAYWEQPLVAWLVTRDGRVRAAHPDYEAVPSGVTPTAPLFKGDAPLGEYWLTHPEQSKVTYEEDSSVSQSPPEQSPEGVSEQRVHPCVPCQDCDKCSCEYMQGLCRGCADVRSAREHAAADIARWKKELNEGKTYAVGSGGARLHRWDCSTLSDPEKGLEALEDQVKAATDSGEPRHVFWSRLPALFTAEELRRKGSQKRLCGICGPDPL
jgi:hypothetical protein